MKKVIYCFSGTGNSMRTARVIADTLKDTVIVNVRNDPSEYSSEDADVIGFVCPVYEWDIPGRMREFISGLSVNPNAYIFMAATYIAVHGRAFETVEGILSSKGAHLSYARPIRCVASQCIAYPPFPPEKIMVPLMEKNMLRTAREIAKGKTRKYPHMSFLTRKLFPKMMDPYLNIEHEYDKGFFTDSRCVGCTTCVKVCPTKNITMENRRPKWNHDCNGCNACVVYCPVKAVQFRTPEAYVELGTMISRKLSLPEKRKRYHNPYISARDLMDK